MFTNLGGPRLWDRDEPRNAGCAREMLDRGDWIVPTFNGELRSHKPVLLYWCIMLAYQALGVSELAARLPSAICAFVTMLCTYAIGRRLFGGAAATWAAVALCSSMLFAMAGRVATPDSVLIACTTLAITIYVLGTFREADAADSDPQSALTRQRHWFPQGTLTVVAMYAVMGLAVLAKGPAGFLLPCAVIGQFLLIMRLPTPDGGPKTIAERARTFVRLFGPRHFLATLWSMRPLALLAAVTAVALPWYWAVGSATEGRFLSEFLLVHHLHRATQAMEGHAGNILFYPAAILIGFFPWSVFAAPLGLDLREQFRLDARRRPAKVFALCWIAVYVVLFSLARTKLPSYITPCFPALALLAGDYISRWGPRAYSGRWLNIAFTCYVLVGLVFCIATPIAAHRYLPGAGWLGLIGLAPLIGGGVCLWLTNCGDLRRCGFAFAGSAVVFTTLIFSVATQQVDGHRESLHLLAAIRSHATEPRIASYYALEPSWVFYSGQSITEFPRQRTSAGEPESQSAAEQLVEFLLTEPSGFVITRREHARELQPILPDDVVVLAAADQFLSSRELVVLGRPQDWHADHIRSTIQQAAGWSQPQ